MVGMVTTNLTDRLASASATNVVEVFNMNDFPAPSAGVITLATGTLYIIKAALSTSDRFVIPAFGVVNITAENIQTNTLTYTGTGVLFTSAAPIIVFDIRSCTVIATMAAATIWSLTGLVSSSFLQAVDCSFSGFGNIGTYDDFSFTRNLGVQYSGWTIGLRATDVVDFVMDRSVIASGAIPVTTGIVIMGNKSTRAVFEVLNVIMPSGDFLFLDPIISANATVNIERTILSGGITNFFEADATGLIAGFADASVAATAITGITSGTGGLARFAFTVGPTLFVNQEVIVSATTTYNHTGVITTTGAGFFETDILFGASGETGSFLSNSMTVSDVAHGLSNGEIVAIQKSINYNFGYTVFDSVADTFRVSIPITFVAETPGATTRWNNGSLTETDRRVDAQSNGVQPDSMIIGGWSTVANATLTPVVDGTYVDVELGTATPLSFNQRLVLFDVTNGAMKYDGQDPAVLKIPIEFRLSPEGGGVRTYEFKLVISTDGGTVFVDLPDVIETQVEAQGTGSDLLFSTFRDVFMNPGDIVKYQVNGVSTALDFTAIQGCTSAGRG